MPEGPEPMEIASLTEPDPLPDVDLDVRVDTVPERKTFCILCGIPMVADPGPAVFLSSGRERVCQRCTRTHDPAVWNELKWRRRDWQSESDWGQ